jgi:hypothetical protein
VSAEDYDDVPGFGSGFGGGFSHAQPKQYTCNFCRQPINFKNRKAHNKDGSLHRCKSAAPSGVPKLPEHDKHQATLFAMAAINAIINASIQSAGVDYIHSMNFYDVADAAWRVSAAMVSKEKAFADEYGRAGDL